ncbi:MAG TPA: hypothetical protein VD927_09730 [Chryseosolibacter sp.]|nr:hypothetical protein [Chryseosolibacter sp.]
MKKPTSIPFNFVLEALESMQPRTNPMFGCHAVYIGEKIMLILRLKPGGDPDNGIWVSSSADEQRSLNKQFPALRPIAIFGEKQSSWQNLPYDSSDFEEKAFEICELIKKRDPRIGKIPKPKKNKKP